jgi:hypothetical protein
MAQGRLIFIAQKVGSFTPTTPPQGRGGEQPNGRQIVSSEAELSKLPKMVPKLLKPQKWRKRATLLYLRITCDIDVS